MKRAWMVGQCVVAGLLGTLAVHSAGAQSLSDLSRTRLRIGHHSAQVEVASTQAQQQKGLMHRKQLGTNEGMLFAFARDDRLCFWMKDTHVPLTVAFITAKGTILNYVDMQPLSEKQHCSSIPARYALEMPQGWFTRHNIQPGARVEDIQGNLFQ